MKLLLDIGNTRIKSALLSDEGLVQHHAVVHAGLSSEQLQTELLQRYVEEESGSVESVWVANVAGAEVADCITLGTLHLWGIEPTFVATTAVHGEVRNAYSQPEKLGVDRWLSLIATHVMHTGAQVNLIVSVGTAMTLDAISADGAHRGGFIVPGPQLMINSLLQHTSDIAAHASEGETGDAFFANNTLGAIHQGADRACVALVESAFRHLGINESTKVLITGGAAPRITPLLGIPFKEVPDLVLQGLAVIARG